MATDRSDQRRGRIKPRALRRDCLSLVCRCASRQAWATRRSVLRDGISRQCLSTSGHAVPAAAVVGAIILAFHAAPEILANSATFYFGRGLAYGMVNIYVVKTASVFMITTSTIGVYTGFTPRWLALGGYAVAAALLIGSYFFDWSILVFPVWVLLISVSILADENVATRARTLDQPAVFTSRPRAGMRVKVRRPALATDIPRRRARCYNLVRFAALAAQFQKRPSIERFGLNAGGFRYSLW